jgi:predicted transcriptional regulator
MPRPGTDQPARRWTFVTNHFLVLLCIAEDPGTRMWDVAQRVGITERAVQGIVADLVEAGYLTRTRVGRRNHYDIETTMPLRHLQTQHRQLGDLLSVLARRKATSEPLLPAKEKKANV